jgi:hypothetical protein
MFLYLNPVCVSVSILGGGWWGSPGGQELRAGPQGRHGRGKGLRIHRKTISRKMGWATRQTGHSS